MSITVTNRIAQPALMGQSVPVGLNATDEAQLPNITIGMKATFASGSIGYVKSVDLYGTSFKVQPDSPVHNLASTASHGILAVGETVTLT